jgi:hypothetical protein
MPGTIGGAFVVDYLGPKNTMVRFSSKAHLLPRLTVLVSWKITGLLLQAVFGFIMSGLYTQLKKKIAAFAVIYGIFLSFGELGPGNCLGLLASKSGPTAVRGQFYGVAAAIGKVGAFAGTWCTSSFHLDLSPILYLSNWTTHSLPRNHRRYVALSWVRDMRLMLLPDFGGASSNRGNTGPFWVGSGLAILSALITFFFIRPLTHDGLEEEDRQFREYLEAHGYDTSTMGFKEEGDDWSEQLPPEKEDDTKVAGA